MNSSMARDDDEDGADWRDKYEQLESALALAQYESRRWKEKYAVERQRRRKIAKDLLDLVALADHPTDEQRASSSARSGTDHLGSILSPTLSSFDFDDDSSEASSDSDGGDGVELPEPVMTKRDTMVALELRDRQSLLYHANRADRVGVRANRSSTTGSALEARRMSATARPGGYDGGQPPQSLMYRILYAKPNARDLWHNKAHSGRLHSVARSIMFSMHLKKEHVFERFVVAGASSGADDASVWKPHVLYEYPHSATAAPDESVADFCFPLGVPLARCTLDQAAELCGAVVSRWFTDADQIKKHVLEPFRTSGYTFRLTGAKGEVLYGFCAAVMKEVPAPSSSLKHHASVKSPKKRPSSPTMSPRSDLGKHASFPSLKRQSDEMSPRGANGEVSGRRSASQSGGKAPVVMAPVCFCFTSKFPFYRLHFSLLRMIIENEMDRGKLALSASLSPGKGNDDADDEFELILRPKVDLGVVFAVLHEENPDKQRHVVGSKTAISAGLGSVASGVHASSVENCVFLSEDVAFPSANGSVRDGKKTGAAQGVHRMRKSHSTDDITTYNGANGWIVDKPMVKRCPERLPEEYSSIQVGDVLEAIDGLATAAMTFDEALELLDKGDRPMRLRFRRPLSTPSHSQRAKIKPIRNPYLTPTSVDILHRARRLKVNDPGHWSAVRFPNFNLNYQLPKRHSERWTCGVVLRFLTPESVVKILTHLLLEKQVVIMSNDPAKVTAVCTAFLLLIAPFQWQSTYIPLLPSGLLDFLHSPVPYIAGCHLLETTEEWPDACFYNIDDDRISAPAESRRLNEHSIPNGVELCKLLRTAKQRFNALRTTGKPWYEISEEEDKIITLTLQESEIFLRDLGFDISSQDLAASLSEGKSFYDRLQEEFAKEVRKSAFEDYLEEFSQTQLFCQYYESLLQPGMNDPKL